MPAHVDGHTVELPGNSPNVVARLWQLVFCLSNLVTRYLVDIEWGPSGVATATQAQTCVYERIYRKDQRAMHFPNRYRVELPE